VSHADDGIDGHGAVGGAVGAPVEAVSGDLCLMVRVYGLVGKLDDLEFELLNVSAQPAP
jgi:hypothetical protein